MRAGAVAAALLLAWWLGHHAYKLAPVAIEGHAWNIGGAAARLVLLGLVVSLAWNPAVHTVAAWIAAEEAQAIGCTVAYIVKPWPMLPGQEKCSEALGLPLQAACLVALLWTGAWLLDRFREGRK
jgi:hypothetical protein